MDAMQEPPKSRIAPLAIAVGASLMGLVIFFGVVFAAPDGHGARAVWQFIQDGGWGVYAIFALTTLGVLATTGTAVWLTSRRSAWSWVPAVAPIVIVVASTLLEAQGVNMAVAAISGESIDPDMKFRILAAGTAEATVLSILGGAAGCALYSAVALVFGARALSRVPSGRLSGGVGAFVGGLLGCGVVLAVMMFVPSFRSVGLGFAWIPALTGWLGAVFGGVAISSRAADTAARGEALGDLLLTGSYALCGVLFAGTISHGGGFRVLTGALSDQSIDPSQAGRIAAAGLAEMQSGLSGQLIWVMPVLVAVAAAVLPAIAKQRGALKSCYGGLAAAIAGGLLGAALLLLPRLRHEARLVEAFERADSTVALAAVEFVELHPPLFRVEIGVENTLGLDGETWKTSTLEASCHQGAESWKRRPDGSPVAVAPDAALPYKYLSCFLAAVIRLEPDTRQTQILARSAGDDQLQPPWGKLTQRLGTLTLQLRGPQSVSMRTHVHLGADVWELRNGEQRETLRGSVEERIQALEAKSLLEGLGVTADPEVPVEDLLRLAGHPGASLTLDVFKTKDQALAIAAPSAEGIGLGALGGLGGLGGLGAAAGAGDAPSVRPGATIVSGRLPPEVIQRIVRQSYARQRLCYETGLKKDPKLSGRVSVRFIVGRDGSVNSLTNHGSDLPDKTVVSCVLRVFQSLKFPEPEGGVVAVAYPIQFDPGS